MAGYIGQQFGNYRLIQLLGQGGFAEVYLAEHVRLGIKAAIKVLHAHLSSEEVEGFQREARTLANLQHPHIVRVLDFDLHESIPFLVLDYAPNGSLHEKHPRGTLVPLALVVNYVQQVGGALDYAHGQRLVHRDVKPGNMLIGKQEEILLGDFGIASVAHSTLSMSTQASVGTLPYMAPEQIQGKPRPASDQYALAVVVYQWLSGQLPFQGASVEIIAQHLGTEAPSLRSQVPSIPEAVDLAVRKAMTKDPNARFSSVLDFANALAQACGMEQSPLTDTILPISTIPASLDPTQPATSSRLARTVPASEGNPTGYAESDLSTFINESQLLIQQRRYQEALVLCEQALQRDPTYVLAHVNKAGALIGLKRYQEALVASEQALQRDPTYALAHVNKAGALIGLKSYQEALVVCDQALQYDPSNVVNVVAHYNASQALIALERYQEALTASEQALRCDSTYVLAYINKSCALVNLKRYQEALGACDQALLYDPMNALAHYNASLALIDLKRYPDALRAAEKAIGLNPLYANAYVNKAWALIHLGGYVGAVEACDRALQLDPGNATARANREVALQRLRH